MKTLYLVRHAKSSWGDSTISDFDRPLNERGNRDKTVMGNRLFNKNLTLDLMISSSAKRTKQTSIGLAKEIGYATDAIHFLDELYHASVQQLTTQINRLDSTKNSVLLVGHNPGISLLCDYLCNHQADFPTLGIACISFETENWEEIFRNTGTLQWFDYPKNEN